MYRFEEIWYDLKKTQLFYPMKEDEKYLYTLIYPPFFLMIVSVLMLAVNTIWGKKEDIDIMALIGFCFGFLLLCITLIIYYFKQKKITPKEMSFLIMFASDTLRYNEDVARNFSKEYKSYELLYALNRIGGIINREENRVDKYNVMGLSVFFSLIITLLINCDKIYTFWKSPISLRSAGLSLIIYLLGCGIALSLTLSFARYMVKEKLDLYKYKVLILETAILQKETKNKIKKKEKKKRKKQNNQKKIPFLKRINLFKY